jgi:two-component system, OmpR family, phosphate regulon response regulator PhoB
MRNWGAVACVLLIDDEHDLLTLLDFNLRAAGFETLLAPSGEVALAHLRQRIPDLILLDLMLPDISGFELHRRMKADPRTSHVPVIMVTAKGAEVDRVVGFELGVEDYVTKPFSVRELILRVRAVLRRPRAQVDEPSLDRLGPIRIDVDAHRCFVDGGEIKLTALEFRLLVTFMARAGRVLSREQLLQDVWEMSGTVTTRTVDTHVKRLRDKLGSGRDLLETVRGVGYRLVRPSRLA